MPEPAPIQQCETTEVIEALERINTTIARGETGEEMLAGVLDDMLEIFSCDRAWLVYPCDPEAESYEVPMERTRPQWPGAAEIGAPIPLDRFGRGLMEACLKHDGPLALDPTSLPIESAPQTLEQFNIRSMLLMVIRPRGDRPWILGIHHCVEPRRYDEAIALFRAIGSRVGDGLTTLLANQRLRQSEERFRTLVENAPEAIVILECEEFTFIDANPKASKLFGLSHAQLTNHVGPVQLSPERQPNGELSADMARRYVSAALAGESPIFEWTHLNSAGEPVPCELRLARLPHPDHRLVCGSITDISARKQAELERAGLEARLAQAQKMEAIGQLTGGIAHDFNNLLTVILGNLELVAERVDESPDTLEQVDYARAAAKRASSLTHRLLAFSRRQPLRPTALDVGSLLRGMDDLLRRTLGVEIEIELILSAGLWRCEADATQLENAILNLAINSRDAMPGGGKLTIESSNASIGSDYANTQFEVKAGQYVQITVTDNGSGMPGEILGEIFSPFFTTKDVGKGSGLGLSMVYGFVKQSGGNVTAYSELGEGTTMKIYLPRFTGTSESTERSGATSSSHEGRNECILIVEDDESVRVLTRKMLLQLGYRVLEADEGAAALKLLAEHPEIDLLLTDIVLPGGMNGSELAGHARERVPGLLVLFMSGYTENAVLHNGRFGPGANLIEKPFTKNTLASRLRAELDARVD